MYRKLRNCCLLFILISNGLWAQDEQNPCLKSESFHIIVLGSSTAAGTGPSTSDSAWVNRFRKHVQAINPNNQVTNFAVGGTTTYHIMPNGFSPPPGRPLPSPSNITVALHFGADAIIVNMPSNDAANNYGLNEQMSNFIAIAAEADTAGVPIWICTTQPKNFSNSNQIQIQTDVRDSILSYFGTRAIDFWTTIANSSNTIDSLYDSGDGTHLNDAAHRILYGRVKSHNILSQLYDTLGVKDFGISPLIVDDISICGDSLTRVKSIITNLGLSTMDTVIVGLNILDKQSQIQTQLWDTLQLGLSCVPDTAHFSFSTHLGGSWALSSFISALDTNSNNDTTNVIEIKTLGMPEIVSVDYPDTICFGDTVTISAITNDADTVFWFKADSLIGKGTSIKWRTSRVLDTLNIKAIKGPLVFKASLPTTQNTNVDWNGVMFNLVAKDTLTIDSLSLKIFSSGDQGVVGYYRSGSYNQYVSNQSAWTFWGKDSVLSVVSGGTYRVKFSSLTIPTGDTIGVYLHMENGTSRLSYQNNGNATSVETDELEFLSGSGVDHTFGGEYYPRFWSGEIFYHHGFNEDGDCFVEKNFTLKAHQPKISLDSILYVIGMDSITLDGGNFISWTWSWYEQDSSFRQVNSRYLTLFNGPFLNPGNYLVELMVVDSIGCKAKDTVTIFYAPNFSLDENSSGFKIYPNPTDKDFHFSSTTKGILEIYDSNGKRILQSDLNSGDHHFKTKLKPGAYSLLFITENGSHLQKLIVH